MDSIENMKTSKSWKNLNLQDLYKCPWFFVELSEEDAKEILVEAKKNDENSDGKIILFSKMVFDEIKKNHFTIVSGHLLEHMIFMVSLWRMEVLMPLLYTVGSTNSISLKMIGILLFVLYGSHSRI